MKYALVSDVHANLEALRAVFARIDADREVLCLGDIVGYGPDPNDCVALVRERAHATVLGNHDVAAIDGFGLADFNDAARDAVLWTQRVITPEHVAWLDGLPYELRRSEFLLVHGAPRDYFRYVLDVADARDAFAATEAPLIFIGHTHVPDYYALAPDGRVGHAYRQRGGELELEPGFRYLVNVGSVGQPRDLNPDASYVLYDADLRRVRWARVPYDVGAVQRKIEAAGLPELCSRRLALGR